MNKLPPFFEHLLGFLLVFSIWFIATLNNQNSLFLPSPGETFDMFLTIAQSPKYYNDILYTLGQSFIAFLISAVFGILIGVILGSSKFILKITEPVIEFFRSIPSTSIFPLFLLVFGIGFKSRIVTAVFVTIWIVILNTIYGIKHAKKTRVKSIFILGGSKIDSYLNVSIYEALPHILSALRLSISLSMVIIIITEMLVSPKFGIGVRIFEFQQYYKIPGLYVYLLTIGAIGYTLNKIFVKLEKKYIHWTNT